MSRSMRSFSEAKRAARSISSRIDALERGAAGVEIGGLGLQGAQATASASASSASTTRSRSSLSARASSAPSVVSAISAASACRRSIGALGVGALRRLAGEIAVEVADMAFEFGDPLLRPALLRFEFVAGVGEALQGRRRLHLGIPQGRQAVGRDGLRGGGAGLLLGAVGDRLQVFGRLTLGGRRLLARIGKADGEQQGLEAPDLGRQVLVARGLPALALQAVDLGLEFAQHVLDAQEVVLGGLEAKLGLVPAGMQARRCRPRPRGCGGGIAAWPK